MDNIKDRGTKKWTAMMLPEHVEMLKEVFAEDEHVEKPILDEQKQMENGMLLHAALHGDLSVEIKYYTNGTFETTQGKILFIDAMGRLLRMEDKEIDIDDIMDVII